MTRVGIFRSCRPWWELPVTLPKQPPKLPLGGEVVAALDPYAHGAFAEIVETRGAFTVLEVRVDAALYVMALVGAFPIGAADESTLLCAAVLAYRSQQEALLEAYEVGGIVGVLQAISKLDGGAVDHEPN